MNLRVVQKVRLPATVTSLVPNKGTYLAVQKVLPTDPSSKIVKEPDGTWTYTANSVNDNNGNNTNNNSSSTNTTNTKKNSKTTDNNNIILLSELLMISSIGLAVLLLFKIKHD